MSGYGTVADFKTYHEDRGRTVSVSWGDDQITAALLLASEWIDNAYTNVFTGFKTDGFLQTREWPRTAAATNTFPQYVFEPDEIPNNVVFATYEAAFRELTEQGSLQKDFTTNQYTSVSVSGAISVNYAGNVTEASDLRLQIPQVEQLLAPLVDPALAVSSMSGGLGRV